MYNREQELHDHWSNGVEENEKQLCNSLSLQATRRKYSIEIYMYSMFVKQLF